VDVAGRIRGGLLENNQSARNDGVQEMRGGGGGGRATGRANRANEESGTIVVAI